MNGMVGRERIDDRGSEAAAMMLLIASGGAVSAVGPNPTLGFITQMWVLGSIVGTGLALLRHRRHPEDPRWALFVGAGALAGALIGSLVAAVDALAS
jgi:hypothetical protein